MTFFTNNNLTNYLKQFESAGLIPSSELNQIICRAQSGDSKATNRIVSSFQYLIVHIAKTSGVLSSCKDYIEDIISVGNLGLLGAIKNFNIAKGASFTSYVKLCITGAIFDFLNKNHQVHYPKEVIQDINKISRNNPDSFISKENSNILAAKTGLSEERILYLSEFNYRFTSLSDSDEMYSEENPAAQYNKKELQQKITQALQYLLPRERFVLNKIYGLDCEPLSYSQIGDALNLSKQRVCQLYKSAIKKLRKLDNELCLSDFIAA